MKCTRISGGTEPHIWTEDLDVALAFVEAGGGESLHTLVVATRVYEMECADNVLKHCPNVTSLSLEESRMSWLDKFPRQLERLEVVTCILSDSPLHSNVYASLLWVDFRLKDARQIYGGKSGALRKDWLYMKCFVPKAMLVISNNTAET